MSSQISFKSVAVGDDKFVIEIFLGDRSFGFFEALDRITGRMCIHDEPDNCFTFTSEDKANRYCLWLGKVF